MSSCPIISDNSNVELSGNSGLFDMANCSEIPTGSNQLNYFQDGNSSITCSEMMAKNSRHEEILIRIRELNQEISLKQNELMRKYNEIFNEWLDFKHKCELEVNEIKRTIRKRQLHSGVQ